MSLNSKWSGTLKAGMRQLSIYLLLLAPAPLLTAQHVISKCSVHKSTQPTSAIDICEVLSNPGRYANRFVTVRGRYMEGEIDTPATVFGDACLSKSVSVADLEELRGRPLPKVSYHDSAHDKETRQEFYLLGMRMCPGFYVGNYIPVEATFTGVLIVKKGFRVHKNRTGNGFGFRGLERIQFVIHSVADVCRVNDCPKPWDGAITLNPVLQP